MHKKLNATAEMSQISLMNTSVYLQSVHFPVDVGMDLYSRY